MARQRAAPCPPPRSVFLSADLSSKETVPCSFHEIYRTIHLYFGSEFGWIVASASCCQFIVVEY